MNKKIYVVEDDEDIQQIVKIALESNNYEVELFGSAIPAIEAIQNHRPDLCIFDIMLPGMDGITAIRKIRTFDETLPIIILSAKTNELDKIQGLDSGSDDYMTKPFSVLELSARVRTLLRRTKSASIIQTSTIYIDKQTHLVKVNEESIELTHKEYQLLVYLIENKDRVVSREDVFSAVWGYEFVGESRVLDVQISSLRKKLSSDNEKYIQTIRSVGYRFIEE